MKLQHDEHKKRSLNQGELPKLQVELCAVKMAIIFKFYEIIK